MPIGPVQYQQDAVVDDSRLWRRKADETTTGLRLTLASTAG